MVKGASVYVYSGNTAWRAELQNYNAAVPNYKKLNYIFPWGGSINFGANPGATTAVFNNTTVNYYAAAFPAAMVLPTVDAGGGPMLSNWSQAQMQAYAQTFFNQFIAAFPNAAGVQLDIEPYMPAHLPFYNALRALMNNSGRLLTGYAGTANCALYAAMDAVMLPAYDHLAPDVAHSPAQYKADMQGRINTAISSARACGGRFWVGIPASATADLFEYSSLTQGGPAVVTTGYQMSQYVQALTELLCPIMAEPEFLGGVIWAYTVRITSWNSGRYQYPTTPSPASMTILQNYCTIGAWPSPTPTGTPSSVAIIADYQSGMDPTNCDGYTGTFTDVEDGPGGTTTVQGGYDGSQDHTSGGGLSFHLRADVHANPGLGYAYAGYYNSLGRSPTGVLSPNHLSDWTSYAALVFWVKGAVGGEQFNIKFTDSSGAWRQVPLANYGWVTTGWTRIVIPLNTLPATPAPLNFAQMKDISWVVPNIGVTEFWIDDVGLINTLPFTATPTFSHSPTISATPTRTATRTPSPAGTATPSPSPTASPTGTGTRTASPSPSPSATRTGTPSATPTRTASATASPSRTPSFTRSPTPSVTATRSQTFTFSPTPPGTYTESPTATLSASPSGTPTETATASPTPSFSPTRTNTPTRSPTATWSATRTATATPSLTATATFSRTASATSTASASRTPTRTATPTSTRSATATATGTRTGTRTATLTATASASRTATATFSDTPTASPTRTASPSVTATPSFTHSPTVSPTFSPGPSFTASPTVTPLPTAVPPIGNIVKALPSQNPARGASVLLRVRLDGPIEGMKAEVFTKAMACALQVQRLEPMGAGWHSLSLDIADLENGLYYYRVKGGAAAPLYGSLFILR